MRIFKERIFLQAKIKLHVDVMFYYEVPFSDNLISKFNFTNIVFLQKVMNLYFSFKTIILYWDEEKQFLSIQILT